MLRDDAIDTSDAPELLDWSGAKRGLFCRPVKQQLMLRLDADEQYPDIVTVAMQLDPACRQPALSRNAE